MPQAGESLLLCHRLSSELISVFPVKRNVSRGKATPRATRITQLSWLSCDARHAGPPTVTSSQSTQVLFTTPPPDASILVRLLLH